MSPLIYTVDANAFELFSRADGRLRALDRMLSPAEVALADKVRPRQHNMRSLFSLPIFMVCATYDKHRQLVPKLPKG